MTVGTNNEQLIQEGIRDLRQNTDFISTLLENMVGYAIIAADFDGNIIAYNEGAHQIYGYTQEEVIGKLGIDIFFPREFIEAGKLQEIVNKIIEHGRFSYEGDKSRKNGESFPARIIFTLTRDNSSNIVGMIEIVADLTEQKKAEKRLRETAAEWQSTFNSMLDLVSIHDKNSRLVRVNRSFAEAHKMQPEDMVGKTCYEVCHKQTHPPAFCPHLETMETGKPSTVEYYDHLLGKHLEVTTSPMLNAEGEVFATVHVAKDITERSFIAKRLHDSKENLEKVVNNSANGIIVASREGKVLYVNPAAELLFGRSKNDLEGELFGFPVASNQKTEIDIVRNGGELVIAEMRIVETEWNEEFAYLISLHDLTESRRMEEVVRQNQQQQLQIRDQFLSRMSHELRSPLTPIHQFVTILLDGLTGDLNAEQREYLQIILRNVTHLRTMVSDLLDVTRAESGKLNIDLRCVYLTELIPPILKTFQLANTKGLLMSFDVPDNLPPICADPDRVRQILDNLLDNAIKFSSEKGEVRVRARVSNQDPGFLRIEVTDTGHGISPGEQGKIFNYLYQVKSGDTEPGSKGLGIGLYICKELVSSHGGRIWVESQPGQGSTFFFTLPVFSLEGQLASIVKAADLITNSVALIMVEVLHAGDRPCNGESDQTELQEAWGALQSCTLPNLVVLLPRVPHTLTQEFFFMVACVNQSRAEVLAEQLRNRLAQCPSLTDSRLKPRVSFILLDTHLKSNAIPAKALVNKKVVDHIKDLMKTALNNGGDLYERSKSSRSG